MINDLANRALAAVTKVMGEPVTYSRGQSTTQVRGVFQASSATLDPDTGLQVRSTQPVLLIDRRALSFDPRQNDIVVARNTTYRVRDAQPDGHNGWLLMLHRSQP